MIEKFKLSNKVAIVTGASKGIGKAIAYALGQQGARVVVSSRSQESVDEVVKKFREEGIEALGIAAHMGDLNQIQAMINQTQEHFGGIDILVNNAAINPAYGPIQEVSSDLFDKVMQVNLKGPMELARLAYPSMKARKGASVIHISSIEGITPGEGLGIYSVSKSALIALTKVQAREWGSVGIRVNAICPGLVKTKFSRALIDNEKTLNHILSKQSLPQIAEPEDIAGLALFLASDAASFCTGGIYVADGGYTI